MCKACDYTIHGAQHHFGWDNSLPPALRVAPGSTIEFHCHDSSAGQLGPSSTLQSVIDLDFGKINPVSGPIYVDGAKPGDVLKVTLEGFAPKVFDGKGFGWTANIPGFGLLADQFTDPALCLWSYDPASMAPAMWGKSARVPIYDFTTHRRRTETVRVEPGAVVVVEGILVLADPDLHLVVGGHTHKRMVRHFPRRAGPPRRSPRLSPPLLRPGPADQRLWPHRAHPGAPGLLRHRERDQRRPFAPRQARARRRGLAPRRRGPRA